MIKLIVEETNRFAGSYDEANKAPKNSRARKWVDTDEDEIRKFIGIILLMGLVQFPQIKLYWSKGNMYGCQMNKDTMPRDRFQLLLKFVHFCNNDLDPGNNRLYKVENFVNKFNVNCKSVLTPGTKLVIDESMVPWRGRLKFRVYNKSKSSKYGIKLYKLCTMSGYTLIINVYGGKQLDRNSVDIGLTHKLVIKLMNDYLNQNKILYTDNYYNSLPLAKDLLSKKTFNCGTLRKNRVGIPLEVLSKKLKKGEIIGYVNSDKVKIVKWKDKRDVLMISTEKGHDTNLRETGKRNRKGEIVKKPNIVLDYNEAKKGVDLSDQMSAYYDSLRKTFKWYKKLIFEIITGTAVVNAWVVYNMVNNTKTQLLNFTEDIIKDLLKNDNKASTFGRRSKHTLLRIAPTDRSGPQRGRCQGCYRFIRDSGKSSREASKLTPKVQTFCDTCSDQPFFCLDCFNRYHKYI